MGQKDDIKWLFLQTFPVKDNMNPMMTEQVIAPAAAADYHFHYNHQQTEIINKLTIIVERGWAKYRDFIGEQINYLLKLRQIIDLWDTEKSRYFVITAVNNCFINLLINKITLW